MQIKAVIFDLDGVIVDTAHYHFLAWRELAHELGIELTPEHNEKLKGVSRIDSLDIILGLAGVSLDDEDKKRLADKKNNWFMSYIEQMHPEEIFPGVKALLTAIKVKGIKLALASSSKNAQTVIEVLRIRQHFDVIVDGNMIKHSKPHPEIFLLAASKLKTDAKDCLVFEDAEAGVEAAFRAGMKCIGVGSKERLAKADKVIMKTGDFQVEMLEGL
jgi:beta-phosphoglucomutase